jgi:aldose sugar dehydrogenase
MRLPFRLPHWPHSCTETVGPPAVDPGAVFGRELWLAEVLMKHDLTLALVLLAAVPHAVQAQVERTESRDYVLNVETVVRGLEHPWALAFLPDGRFLVTERDPGTIRVGTVDGRLSAPIHRVVDLFRPVGPTPRSQAGLFSLKLHPDFTTNGLVYWVYSRTTERGAALVIQRGRLSLVGDAVTLHDVEDVWVMDEDSQDSSGVHFGGRLLWGPDGMLYLTIGERFVMNRAQDLEDQAGSVLRMTPDGQIPADNPRFDGDADPYLFTGGHRNIQAIAVRPGSAEIWAVEHGPQGGDEINRLVGGNNYGWPFLTGGRDYSDAPIGVGTAMDGKTSAVHIFEETLAPSGLAFVHEEPGLQAWAGDMIVGGLVAEGIVRVRLGDGAVIDEEWIEIGRRIRDVKIRDGSIWVVTEHEDGEVLRITPQR